MKRYIAIVTVAFILVSSTAAAKNPPLGKRKYLVDKEKHFSTVVIIPIADPSKGEYLRDPIISGSDSKKKVVAEERRLVSGPTKIRKSELGILNFGPLQIEGRLIRPRVNFAQEPIPIKKWDEPLTSGSIEKIFDTADKLDIDL